MVSWLKMFILLMVLVSLFGCGSEQAGLTEDGHSETRSYQTGLWSNPTSADADIAFFSEGQTQPQGNSVLLLGSWQKEKFRDYWNKLIDRLQYDFTRIQAVLVDEPYLITAGNSDWSNPCRDARKAILIAKEAELRAVAAVVKVTSAETRFWVNFSEPEIQWMMDSQCPASLNQPYLDVVSLDVYLKSFDAQPSVYYGWLIAHRASPLQQIALVPGTFFREGIDDPMSQAAILPGYFEFADRMNQHCPLPQDTSTGSKNLGNCPVWIVAGWLAPSHEGPGGVVWRGEQDPASTTIANEWRRHLSRRLILQSQ